MYQILKKAFEHNKPVTIFINKEKPCSCVSGYVAALNEREAAMLLISDNGDVDSLTVLNVSQVFRIDMDGTYEQRLADAYKRKGNPYPPFAGKGELFMAISEYAVEQHFPLWIAIQGGNEAGGFGKVSETSDDMIVITRLDDQNNESRSYISKQAIKYIECDYQGNGLSETP